MKVVDGDTVEVLIHLWLGQEVITRVRLLGIDAPEIAGACGPERVQAVAARDGPAALVGEGPVTLVDLRPDKYFGRVVGRLLTGAGDNAGAMLIREGLARPYAGGRRQGWCVLPALMPTTPQGSESGLILGFSECGFEVTASPACDFSA